MTIETIGTPNHFSCFIIGEGSLPIQCAEILLHRGHEICGIISPDATISRWAEGKNIPHADPSDALIAFLRRRPFDYLFSIVNIVNYRRLLKESLKLPRRCSINYHDALLPRYAGFHPTSWALMDRKTTHGVTWHLMTDRIDAGDILRQCPVDIADDDTAFTLNAKCYDAAIRSFAELVEDLSCAQVLGRKQNLDQRTYSTLYKRPPVGCVLSWSRCGHDIDAFIRALDFGPYPNPLGLPKLVIGEDFIIVGKTEVLDSRSETPPGTVTKLDHSSIQISTASHEIVLHKLLTIDGHPLSIPDAVARFGLHVGHRFTDLDPEPARRITEFNALICKHEPFWVKRLAALQPVALPYAARNRSQVKPAKYASVSWLIPEEVTLFLEGRQGAWGMGDFVLAAFVVYLARVGGVCRFDVGFSAAELQRDLAGLEGLFARHVPFCVDGENTQSFAEVFCAVREQVALVTRHKTYARDAVARYPFLRSAREQWTGQTLTVIVEQVERLDDYKAAPGSEFTFLIQEDKANSRWIYDPEILDGDSVARMLRQFNTLLQDIIKNPDRRIADLLLLSEKERHQLLVEFNNTDVDYPEGQCIHQLFEAQAKRTPDVVAIVFEDKQTTYQELNSRANQLAHHLKKRDIGPESLVAICLERSTDMIVGLLGILKAGGAYVPLDPTHPQARLAFMLEDSQARVVLTQERLHAGLPPTVDAVCLDTDWERIAKESDHNPVPCPDPDNLAYVIYTSGSTGQPKGVMIQHKSLVNYLSWVNVSLLGEKVRRVPMVSSLSFDASLKQLFAPLLRGDQVWILEDEIVAEPATLLQVLGKQTRVGLNCVPSLWKSALDMSESSQASIPAQSLACLFLGGEPLSKDLVIKSRAMLPDLQIWNLYGPTETTANASAARIIPSEHVSIGRPIANAQIYLLDQHEQPVPIGVAGELHIGGDCLARGYNKRAELTAERFIPNPFSREAGTRLYRTGDLARYLSDGNIEFLGRVDHQVKIRGFRIECGEIETALNTHPAVREALVVAREDGLGEKRLVAYVVRKPGRTTTVNALRGYLKQKLPDYMVPSSFVFLDRLPLTPNGKVDRKALPAHDPERPELGSAFVPSRTPTEELLVGIWGELLGLSQIGVEDHFFELGGHSLLATRVLSRVLEVFRVELPLRSLFEAPTVAGLAKAVERVQQGGQGWPALPILPVRRVEPLPLSFAQQRLWFLDQLEPGSPAYNIAVALSLKGDLQAAALEWSVGEIVRRHEVLRTTFATENNEPIQVITPVTSFVLPVEDLTAVPVEQREAEARRRARAEAIRPFDLATGPLMRARLLQLNTEEHVLLLTMHHIVSDGWSMGILFQELSAFYEAFATGKSPGLPELSIQYADYTVWQREWLQGEEWERQLGYWKKQLRGAPPVLELPTDRPRPAVPTYRGEGHTLTLSPELSEGLKRLSRAEGVTLFMTLLAAFQVLLYRYTRLEDIVVGAPIANRNRSAIEGLIGFFVNTLVLRTGLSGDPSFQELLRRVRKTALDAYSHQDLPFEKLVEELQPERSLNQNPLFQVGFALQNASSQALSLPGLDARLVEVDAGTSKFDLTLVFYEKEDHLEGALEYSTDLFDGARMTRMNGHLQVLLEAVVASPDSRVSRLPLLKPFEKEQLLKEWNDTAASFPLCCVHQLFEAHAESFPERVAVDCGSDQLTYRELNNRANLLAHKLKALGVGPEVRVGVAAERSLELIAALLGIFKAGGAYIPLDPIHPEDRLSFMVQDAQIGVLLACRRYEAKLTALACKLPVNSPLQLVWLDSGWDPIASMANPLPSARPEHLAYVIYTSGSTGKPKGVLVTHKSLSNVIEVQTGSFEITRESRVGQLISPTFDVSLLEIFGALTAGATLCPLPQDQLPGSEMVGWLQERAITILNTTPSFLTALPVATLPNLKTLTVGGEPCTAELVSSWSNGRRFINAYGPTETTIFSIWGECRSGCQQPAIGRPLSNTYVYVLDEQLEVVPVGVPGELLIGGMGLGRGYLNRPDITAERFIPNPFSLTPGDRLYRTGDLVQYRPDGNLEFVGRLDYQVKLRGFRIELGEIESVLRQHPSVREAVVLVQGQGTSNERLMGYVTARGQVSPDVKDLRSSLKERLPDYMVPSVFLMLDQLPLTSSGKLDRGALPTPEGLRPELEAAYVMPTNEVERVIANLWREMLKLEKVGINDNFFDLGGHSLLLAQLHSRLRGMFDREVSLIEMFEYPTVSALAKNLSKDKDQHSTSLQNDGRIEEILEATRHRKPRVEQPEIAIIGMACRFPGAKGVDEFWHNLSKGLESITSFSDEELKASGVESELLKNPDYVKSGSILEGIELFDATFFGFNAREAEVTDPQHRLFLECAWEALENAGYDAERYDGLVGVFAGASMNSYLSHHYTNPNLRGSPEGYQLVIGNDIDFVPTRVSYKLGLKGPSVNIQTACSTSLVAVHLASQSLLNGECVMALAGAVSICASQKAGYLFQEGMIYSPDGHCRAFDAKARGTIGGNGLGIVVLKRLADALRDGDTIHAVIKGSAINNDGSLKAGYTAPSVSGQADVIKAALMKAAITAETVGYIEAHGTGTELGDPIEIAALTKAFRASTNRTGFCGIGSVKTNIGHLNTAAGMAGLIKAVLALKNKQLPQSLHFERPNPKIDFDNSPFYVVTKLTEWEPGPIPRRAGVSSFGIGGTNAHVVLEEAPVVRASGPSRPWHLLLLSAKTNTALESSTLHLSEHLRIHSELNLADVAYTLKLGRRAFKHRRMLVCRDAQDALSVLENLESNRLFTSIRESETPSVVFMFSGQGSQYLNMALDLYRMESIFRKQVDYCSEFLKPHLGFDMREVLFPGEEHVQSASHQLNQTAMTQPALFVIEYALAKTLMGWGVKPVAMIGHSIGEYVAACLAGVFSLEDALTLVAERGRLMNQLPRGSMLAVPLPEEEVRALLGDDLSVAAVNAPSLCVVSGPTEPVDRLNKKLTEKGLETVRLLTSHAFHSPMMDPILELFTDQVRKLKLSPPKIPCLSNVSGTWMTAIQATDPEYWARQMRQTVRFSEGLHELAKARDRIFLEIGPGRTLSLLAKQHVDEAVGQMNLSSLRHPKEERQSDLEFLLKTVGQLWLAGIWVDWAKFYAGECRRRLPLPNYPFERERYWVEPERALNSTAPTSFKKPDISDWFYIPSWKRSTMPQLLNHENSVGQELAWLVFDDGFGLGSQVAQRLQQLGLLVTMVRVGERFSRVAQDLYLINPRANEDYVALFRELGVSNRIPGKIVHLWCVSPSSHEPTRPEHLEKSQDLGLYSLLYLAQAIGELSLTCPFRVAVVSNNVQEVTGEEPLCPEKATVLGPCKIIPLEYPNIGCRSIDVVVQSGIGIQQELIDPLLAELAAESPDPVIAYRGKHRWVQTFEPIRLKKSSIPKPRLKEKGVYLITGGLGGIGMALTEHLAKTLRAKLVLTGRSGLLARDEWELWLSHHDVQDAVSMKIQKLKSLEALGAEILIVSADASNLKQMRGVIAQARERFERINGVIHCAGIADYAGIIQRRSREMTEEILAPKVKGTLVLDTVLRGADLDFFVLCSSLGSILYHSKFGQVAYNAANEFLDAFALHRTRRDGTFTVTVNWTDWQEAGMSVDAVKRWIKTHSFPEDPSILQSALSTSAGIRDSMLSSEGAEVFERVLANQFARVVVSTEDLGAMIKEDSASTGPAFLKITEQITRSKPNHQRPQLSSSFVAPRGKVEQAIAKIWQELIGFEQLGIHDNFFELGGDSLLATRVVARVQARMGVEVPLRVMFDCPTLAELALAVVEKQAEHVGEIALNKVLAEL